MSPDTFLYFAYGSNMLTRRLLGRAPSARAVGVGTLAGHELRWHKVSKDGSGKCDIVSAAADSVVHGVLFEIARADKPALDKAEGLGWGYKQVELEVQADTGAVSALSYQATNIDHGTRPYDWYKALVVAGAQEHRLARSYVQALEAVQAVKDWDAQRAEENLRALSLA
jgi:gamma-glutamylcyclotransferase